MAHFEEEEEEAQTRCRILWFLNLTFHRTARRRRGKRRRRNRWWWWRKRRRRRRRSHGKDPGDRRRSVS
jgi:hypothetical protein